MTEKLLSPLRTRRWPERWLTRVLGAVLSCAAYLVCLPWDLRNRVQLPGSDTETTPATGIGALLLGVTLLLLAAYFGHRDALGWPLLLVAAPPATLMYLSLSTHPGPPDGLANAWPLAWGFFTFLIAAGVFVAAVVARQFRADSADEERMLARRS